MSGDRHEAAVCLHERVVSGLVLERTRGAVGRDRHVDYFRTALTNRLVFEAQALHDTRSGRLQEDICFSDQHPEDVLALFRFEIDLNASFAAVYRQEKGALSTPEWRRPSACRITRRGFDLSDVRS